MNKNDYPIFTDDGKLFCKKIVGEHGEPILEGAKGVRITFASLSEQVYNQSTANKKRGKTQQRRR